MTPFLFKSAKQILHSLMQRKLPLMRLIIFLKPLCDPVKIGLFHIKKPFIKTKNRRIHRLTILLQCDFRPLLLSEHIIHGIQRDPNIVNDRSVPVPDNIFLCDHKYAPLINFGYTDFRLGSPHNRIHNISISYSICGFICLLVALYFINI